MLKNATLFFIFTIIVSVFAFIAFFIYFSTIDRNFEEVTEIASARKNVEQRDSSRILNKLSKIKRDPKTVFLYNEARLDFDLNKSLHSDDHVFLKTFRLMPYQIFCLDALLKESKFKYILEKDDNEVRILIFTDNIERIDLFQAQLRAYDIYVKKELIHENP